MKLLQKITRAITSLKHYINGDFAYEKYLEHHNKIHFGQKALDKKSFLKNQLINKWSKVNRCC